MRFFVFAIIVFVIEAFVAKLASELVQALVLCFVVKKPTPIFKWLSTEAAMKSFMTFHVLIVRFFIGESGLAHVTHEWKIFIWNSRFHGLWFVDFPTGHHTERRISCSVVNTNSSTFTLLAHL